MNGPTINGDPTEVCLFLVCGRHENGMPRECRMILDDEKIELKGGEEFITAFVPKKALKPRD